MLGSKLNHVSEKGPWSYRLMNVHTSFGSRAKTSIRFVMAFTCVVFVVFSFIVIILLKMVYDNPRSYIIQDCLS